MRGIVDASGAVPHWCLDRSEIKAFVGTGGGKGVRSVASYDEDAVTLAVQAARRLRGELRANADVVTMATTSPIYLEKGHASLIHAAIGAPRTCSSFDVAGLRAGGAALANALRSTTGVNLVLSGDLRGGLAGGADEANGGDAGAAIVIANDAPSQPVIAQLIGTASVTAEYLDRWRVPGAIETRMWEERFGEQQSTAVGTEALTAALKDAGLERAALQSIVVSNVHARVPATVTKGVEAATLEKVPSPTGALGFTGASDALLGLVALLEQASPGDRFALVSIADGADAFIFEATPAIASWKPVAPLAAQIAARAAVPYGRYLSWRGVLPVQPPNRPEPARMSAPAANRRLDWKYALVGSQDEATGATHLPPARVSWDGGAIDHMHPIAMADALGEVATFTVDRLAWSPSPPVIFAVVDFEHGGRVPIELTDCAPTDIAVGTKVEMTFRRINSADGIANYFWKARPHTAATD